MLLYCFNHFRIFWGGGLMFLIPLLLTIIVIYGLYMIIKRPARMNDNLEILKSRLAKGEITAEEYENIKNHLK